MVEHFNITRCKNNLTTNSFCNFEFPFDSNFYFNRAYKYRLIQIDIIVMFSGFTKEPILILKFHILKALQQQR